MRRFVSQVRELCAGAAFALAGFSSGRGDCARGGCSARRCVPAGMFCARLTPVVRFYRGVLRSSHARRAVLLECSALDHARRAVLLECSALVSRPPCVPAGMFRARSRPPCGSVGMFCARFTPAVRFYRGVLRSITPAVRFCWNVLRSSHARRAVLLECSALVSRPPCGSIAVFCARFTPAVRFYRGVLRSSHARRAVLLECSALASRPPCGSVGMSCARSRLPCGSVGMSCARFTPVSFPSVRKRKTACGILRFYSAGAAPPVCAFSSVYAVIRHGAFTSGLCAF